MLNKIFLIFNFNVRDFYFKSHNHYEFCKIVKIFALVLFNFSIIKYFVVLSVYAVKVLKSLMINIFIHNQFTFHGFQVTREIR